MKIMVATCPHCKKRSKVQPKFFGKQVKCPSCEHPMQIPAEIIHAKLVEHEKSANRTSQIKSVKGCCLGAILFPTIAFVLALIVAFLPKHSPTQARSGMPPDLKVTIIEESTFHDYKRSVAVRLNHRVSKDILRTLAKRLKAQDPNRYDRTFISYLLPGMKPNAGAWATTHFNPDLKVKILGTTLEDEARLAQAAREPAAGKVLGRWRDNSVFSMNRTIILTDEDGVIFMTSVYADGSNGKNEIEVKKFEGETRYHKKGETLGEYFAIKSNGDLVHGDKDGIWATSKRIKGNNGGHH